MIGWYVGLIGLVLGIAGAFYFAKSLISMKGVLKESIFYLVFASFLYMLFSGLMIFLGLQQHSITDPFWELIPVLFFVSTLFFLIGSYKLVQLSSKLK